MKRRKKTREPTANSKETINCDRVHTKNERCENENGVI